MSCRNTPKDLNASIVAGSEEVYDLFCQPCSSEQHLEAVGYCQDCSQYLCITCIKYHSKLAGTAHHTVLDKSAMPKTKIPLNVQNTDILTEKCRHHPDKILEYFCKTHNKICCSVCVTLDHDSCLGKKYIPDISSEIANSQEYDKLKSYLNVLVGTMTKRQKHINNDYKENEKCHAKTMADIKAVRKQLNEFLDQMEEDAKRKVARFHQENISILKSASEKVKLMLSEMESMAVNMDTPAKAGKHNQLFVQMQLSRNCISEVLKQMDTEYTLIRYSFDQDEKVQQMKSTLSTIWSVRQNETLSKARYVRKINVKTNEDTEECFITGLALLANGRMAMTDYYNRAVKLIELKANKLVSRLALPSEPRDLTVMKHNQVAVALGNEDGIQIITVSDVLSLNHTIKTPRVGMAGLCYNGSNFITACDEQACIKIIDVSGKTLTTISTGKDGKQLFTSPHYIVLSRDKDVVFITDVDANTLTSMTLSGQVISVYRHDKLILPLGVAVDKDGAVYVCSHDTHTVHQLTPNGDTIRIILERQQGLVDCPYALTYSDEENMLYISSYSNKPEEKNYIRLYQLE